jgi:Laminin B (Domain IV)/PEP-CTERM motif
MKWFIVAVAILVIGSSSEARGSVVVSSTFDNPADGIDGWTVVSDGSGPSYQASGGDPGGYITTTDQGLGGIVYWLAPAKFLGDQLSALGGTVSFDLRQNINGSQFTDMNPLIRLTGNGVILSLPGTGPGTSFTSYAIPLSSAGGWMSGGVPATDAQIQNALANLTDVRIRAEFSFVVGDVNDLDNVAFSAAAVPEPSTLVLAGLGIAVLALRRVRLRQGIRCPGRTASRISSQPVGISLRAPSRSRV